MSYEITGSELHDDLAAMLEDLQSQMVQSDWRMLPATALHGFITAVAIGPRLVMPSVWLPRVFLQEEGAPEFKDEKQAQKFMHALLTVYSGVLQTIQNGSFSPYVSYTIQNGKETEDLPLWCAGFLHGICVFDEGDWNVFHDAELAEICLPIFFNSSTDRLPEIYNKEQLKRMEARKVVFGDLIADAVYDINDYFNDTRVPPRPISEEKAEPKIGRNDPCPCGSGKKHKKCCGGKQ